MINLKYDKKIQVLYDKMNRAVEEAGFNIDDLDLRLFTTRAGADYPIEPGEGILFYGRATNGWDDDNKENDDLKVVLEKEKSRPFFKLLYYFAWEFYGDSWSNKVAWSNICKIAPDGGNPKNALWYAQEKSLALIIRREVELLSPGIIVLVTGNTAGAHWHSPFFEAFPDLKEVKCLKWGVSRGNDCTATLYTDGKIKVILTDRPEARPIQQHTDALIKLLE